MYVLRPYFIVILLLFCAVSPVKAGIVEGSSCDSNFLEVMDVRAQMAGKREMEIAQAIILKPDSVLEYSCFAENIRGLGIEGSVIEDPLNSYINANFRSNDDRHYAGGRYQHFGSACDLMASVWRYSKCRNVEHSLFLSLDQMANNDKRSLPQACSSNVNTRRQAWSSANAKMNSYKETIQSYIPPLSDPLGLSADFDNVNRCAAFKPIETGLTVFERIDDDDSNARKTVSRVDRICPAPGCYYDVDPSINGDLGSCRSIPPI